MIAVVVVVQLLAAAPPPWCAEAARRLEGARSSPVVAPATIEGLLASLPAAVAVRARDDIGREARLEAAVDSAATAIHTACGAGPSVDVGAALEVQELLRASRFRGLRTEDDFSDKLLDRIWKWIEALLESDGMQLFADNTRVVYLSLLAIVGVVVAIQLLRRSRRAADYHQTSVGARVERQRLKAFAAWRAEALPLVDDDVTARRALLLLRAALLARVGEEDRDAVTPSRTSTEILQRLGGLGAAVAPALSRFDAAFYAGRADAAAARALLIDVDEAAGVLLRAARAGRA